MKKNSPKNSPTVRVSTTELSCLICWKEKEEIILLIDPNPQDEKSFFIHACKACALEFARNILNEAMKL